jgi:hypothetical protein
MLLLSGEISVSQGDDHEDGAVFWDIAPCSLAEIDRLLEVLTASIIGADSVSAVIKLHQIISHTNLHETRDMCICK